MRIRFTNSLHRFAAVPLGIALLVARAAAAQTPAIPSIQAAPHCSISGIVVDASGAAVVDASVQIPDPANAPGRAVPERSTTSDKRGLFSLSGLPAGHTVLAISAPGFGTKDVSVTVGGSLPCPSLRIVLAVGSVNTTVSVRGREDDLSGIADSGSQGSVGAGELATRPILRSGEVLEAIPGVIITQHAGGGKANQYFLRGFNLDHGTDFAIFIDGMPLNLPSHAHGEGYADMNTVIPELVRRVDYEKGPYVADVGNYGSAGSAHLEFFRTVPRNFAQLEGGMFGFGRLVFGASHSLGTGDLLVAGEVSHDDGPWSHPDNYFKVNGLLTYSHGDDSTGFSLSARAYHGQWHSSDQIAAGAVPLVGLFGTLNPTDGGHSQRYSLQGQWRRSGDASHSEITAFGFYYDLDLFSDFTYFLTDPRRGDQFEQHDRRWVTGVDAHHALRTHWFGRNIETVFGLQLRNDWIRNGLFQSEDRLRVSKVDLATGNSLPATTQADQLTDTQLGLYAESRVQWAEKVRSVLALRGDLQRFNVTSLVTAANSGTAGKALPSPKASLIFGPWRHTELYTQAGFGFHSNDGRGTTLTIQPVSGDNPVPGTAATPIPALIPTKGGEFGVRSTALPHLQSTVSVWYLHSASELQQSGDTGGTTASQQPSQRFGVEWANFYTPAAHWAVDFDLADSRALFTQTDADDAAPGSPGGKRVPEAVGIVLASGVTLHDVGGFSSSLRLRLFGPRDLTSDSLFRSRTTALLNAELGYTFLRDWRVSTELLNLLNRHDHDIDYAYTSRITPSAPATFTDVFHPVEPFQARFSLRRSF